MNKKFSIYFIVCCLCTFGCLMVSCKKYENVKASTLTPLKEQTLGYYPTYFQIEGNIFAGLGSIGFPPTSGANKKWYKYNIQEDIWQEMREFPGEKRASRTSFSFKGKGYLIGGRDVSSITKVFNDFWQYDPQTDEWTEKNIPPLTPLVVDQYPPPLYRISTTNHLFIIEGNKLWEYLPENDSWQVVSSTIPFSVKQGFNALTEMGYAISADSTLWEYNPTSSQWKSLIKVQESSGYFIIKNKLYTAGIDSKNKNSQDINLRSAQYLWEYNWKTKSRRRVHDIPVFFQYNLGFYTNILTFNNEEGIFSIDYRGYPKAMYKFTP